MKKTMTLVATAVFALYLAIPVATFARSSGHGSHSSRPYYGGGRHTRSHGGHYTGATNSHHKGGHYANPRSHDRYGVHKP